MATSIKNYKSKLQALEERVAQLLKECDLLQCENNMLKKEALVKAHMNQLPLHAKTQYVKDRLFEAKSEEEMKEIIENQLAATGKGLIKDCGDEFGTDSKVIQEGDKKDVIEAVKGSKVELKIHDGGKKE